MKIDFSCRLSSDQCVSQVVIAEAVAMFVGGRFLHHCSEVELSEVAHYRVEPAEGCLWSIQGSSLTEDINRKRESLLQGILCVCPSANRLVGVRTRLTQDSCPKRVTR